MHKMTKPISALNSCSHIPFLQLMHCFKLQLFCRSMSICHRQKLPVSRNVVTSLCTVVLFGTSLPGYMFHEQQQTISMLSNVQEWTDVLFMRRFCATGVSSGLATTVTLTRVMQYVEREYYTGVNILMITFLYRSTWLLLGCVLNGTLCVADRSGHGYTPGLDSTEFLMKFFAPLKCITKTNIGLHLHFPCKFSSPFRE
jgi:hypothetical protein